MKNTFALLALLALVGQQNTVDVEATALPGGSEGGVSVAISRDGNFAAAGAPKLNSNVGGTYIFSRSSDTWTQQDVLVGTADSGLWNQGSSVALSTDGSVLVTGGLSGPAPSLGHAWAFSRTGTSWSQIGSNITMNTGGLSSVVNFGASVAVCGNGDAIVVGAPGYAGFGTNAGAAAVFTRTEEGYVQYGDPVQTSFGGASDYSEQGSAVACSDDASYIVHSAPLYKEKTAQGDAVDPTPTKSGVVIVKNNNDEFLLQADGVRLLGTKIAISEDARVIVASGVNATNGAGVVVTFIRVGYGYGTLGQILANSGANFTSLALSKQGTVMLAGASTNIFRYSRSGTEDWVAAGPLTGLAGDVTDVAISGDGTRQVAGFGAINKVSMSIGAAAPIEVVTSAPTSEPTFDYSTFPPGFSFAPTPQPEGGKSNALATAATAWSMAGVLLSAIVAMWA